MRKFTLFLFSLLLSMSCFARQPSSMLLHPINYTLNLIDIQGRRLFATKNIDVSELRIKVAIAAAASKIFKRQTVVTANAEKSFNGPVFPEVNEFYSATAAKYIERTNMSTWGDMNAYIATLAKGKKKIVLQVYGPVCNWYGGTFCDQRRV
jgi:hypothetical protein